MSNKAFTLIELLAVIVILAIIALIAVPIVVNIIDDSKKSSNEESIKMYGKAIENAAGNYFLKYPNSKTVTVQNLKNENLINYDGAQVECKIEKIYKSGKIYLKDCTVGGTKVDYTYGEESYKDYIHLVEDAEPIGLSPGDKYTYDVNDNDTFYFYILSIEEDQVNLIMDRNICNSMLNMSLCTISWYDDKDNPPNYDNDINRYGPITALQELYSVTKNWNNVPNMDMSGDKAYEDEGRQFAEENNLDPIAGYGRIETTIKGIKITMKDGTEVTRETSQTPVIPYEEGKPLKARLPKYGEVFGSDGKHCYINATSCPAWLVNNLKSYEYYSNNEHIEEIQGYWLLSSYAGFNKYAYVVEYDGYSRNRYVSDKRFYGIRPVITVPMSNF